MIYTPRSPDSCTLAHIRLLPRRPLCMRPTCTAYQARGYYRHLDMTALSPGTCFAPLHRRHPLRSHASAKRLVGVRVGLLGAHQGARAAER